MLEPLYKAIRDRLSAQVTELRLIDLDTGQIELQADSYPLLPPAAFIDFNVQQWVNTSRRLYVADVQVVVRLVFDIVEDMSNLTPTQVSDDAFAKLALQQNIHQALCGFSGTFFNSLTLLSGPQLERRDDGYKVYEYVYVTNVRNNIAMQAVSTATDVLPVVERPDDTDVTNHTMPGDVDPVDPIDPIDPLNPK